MAFISTIEINHDKANIFRDDPKFGEDLYMVLARRYRAKINDQILKNYGIKIINQRHSSDNPPRRKGRMKDYTVDQITRLTKEVNRVRDKLFQSMAWKKKPALTEGDVRIVLETEGDMFVQYGIKTKD